MKYSKLLFIGGCALLVAACGGRIVKQADFSGYLTDYDQLEVVEAASGKRTLRWVSDKVTSGNYQDVIIDQVVYYPEQEDSDQVSYKLLSELKHYSRSKLEGTLTKHQLLGTQSTAQTMALSIAITGVEVSSERFKVRELIPLKLVLAGAGALMGTRDKEVDVNFEIVAKDSLTNEALFTVVHTIRGDQLENSWEQMEVKHIQAAFDEYIESGVNALAKTLKGK